MAFRRPAENQNSPSLGYRLSSNRQPGVEIANNRMPQYSNPIDRGPRPFPIPGQGRPAPMPRPMPMPMPGPMEPFRPPPGMNPMRPMMSGERQGIDSLTPSNIGADRGPTTTDPLMAFATNPQVRRDFMDKYELEQQMDPDNFFTNRMDIGEQFNVNPFGDIDYPKMSIESGDEQAALDPSDYRTIMKILAAGGNPEDYMAANRGGIASLMR